MPRVMNLSIPRDQTDAVLKLIKNAEGIINTSVIQTTGPRNIIIIDMLDRHKDRLLKVLQQEHPGLSDMVLKTSDPASIFAANYRSRISTDVAEASWEEMEMTLARESNSSVNSRAIMLAAGFIASFGLATNALNLVLAGMLIAPGFEPILRIGLGIVSRSSAWRRGLVDTLEFYALLVVGAIFAAAIVTWSGADPAGGEATYLPSHSLISYWTRFGLTNLLAAAGAATAGVFVVAGRKSILTAGVMIALGLVPNAAAIGIGIVNAQGYLIARSVILWLVYSGIVLGCSILVLAYKRFSTYKRNMWI